MAFDGTNFSLDALIGPAEDQTPSPSEGPPERGRLLIVDDDPSMLRACERMLGQEGFDTIATGEPERAAELADSESFDVALVDLRMPVCDGLKLMQHLQRRRPDLPVILMTGYADIDTAVTAVKQGAFDFLTKPFESGDELVMRLEKAVAHRRLLEKTRRLEAEVGERYNFDNIVGESSRIREVYRLVAKVAPSSSNVLIQGESGTGKELIARGIHFNSLRRDRSLVTVNCSAITESLFESELFGHEKGAFTGAIQRKRGLFEEAHTGTIFLDEIGEVPLSIQPKLLRVLQEGEIRRVGGTDVIRVDVRVIAATNRDVAAMVAEGTFREDLYYRLNVINVQLPPLRERREDIPLLVHHFLNKYAGTGRSITPDALQALEEYAWPGNIRELENVVERAVVLAEGDSIGLQALPAHLVREIDLGGIKGQLPLEGPYRDAKQTFLQQFDRAYGALLLERAKGNVTLAAEMAGMDRSNFRKILKRAGLLRGMNDEGESTFEVESIEAPAGT